METRITNKPGVPAQIRALAEERDSLRYVLLDALPRHRNRAEASVGRCVPAD
jgi:hypothetical protein